LIPSLIDIVFISLIIQNSTDPGNSWFLLYLFPIVEVSKYLGNRGIFAMSLCSIGSYVIVYLISERLIELRWLVMRCLVFLGIAAVAVNVAKTRHKELLKLIRVHEEITQAIYRNPSWIKFLT
jgi:hypothetical protein